MTNKPLLYTTLCSLILTTPLAIADNIVLPINSQGAYLDNIERPQRHQTTGSVIEQFGEPLNKQAATGEPPISRWDYEHFGVYFENDHVIHTVLKHRRQDQLPGKQPSQ